MTRSSVLRYPWAFVSGALAVQVAYLLEPSIGLDRGAQATSFPLLLAAVMFSAWYGGLGPGMVVTIIGTLADMAGSPALYGPGVAPERGATQLIVFALSAILISGLSTRLRNAYAAAEAARTRAEESAEALRFQKAVLEAQSDASIDGILVVGPAGEVCSSNRRFAELWELPAGEGAASGRDVLERVARHRLQTPEAFLAAAASLGADPQRESRQDLLLSDGRVFDHYSAPIKAGDDGPHYGRVWVFRDITERKRAERERAELVRVQAARDEAEATVRRLAYLSDASAALTTSLDYDATLKKLARLAIPAVADHCFVDAVGEEGALRRIASAHANADDGAVVAAWDRRLAEEPSHPVADVLRTGQYQTGSLRGDGKPDAACDGATLESCATSAPRFVVVPLTVQSRTVAALTVLLASLERSADQAHAVLVQELASRASLALENAQLYRQAQEAIGARDKFIAVAAHELRAPIARIKGYAEALLLADADTEPEWAERATHRVNDAADRLGVLVSELLDASSLRGNGMMLHLEDVDLAALIGRVIVDYQHRLAAGHLMMLDTMMDSCHVKGDPDRLEQVIVNLLDNAVKYSPAGGVVRVSARLYGGRVLLTVRDAGIGLPPDEAERIFEPFGRASNAQERQIPGMGLGLHICRQIVEAHRGQIVAKSDGEGLGTTIMVWLPLQARARRRAILDRPGHRRLGASVDPSIADRGLGPDSGNLLVVAGGRNGRVVESE